METLAIAPRGYAAAFLLVALLGILAVCRRLAVRSRRPAVVWGSGGYFAFLHLLSLVGMLTSTRFDAALAQLTLFTFPLSILVADGRVGAGFGTLPDIAINYMRYVVCLGGLNTVLFAGFLTLVLGPVRALPRSSRTAQRERIHS
jgi:hypothetical protein